MFETTPSAKDTSTAANSHGSIQNRSYTPVGLYRAKCPKAWGQLICTHRPVVLRDESGEPIIETKKVFAMWCCWLLEPGTQTKQCGHNGWKPGQGRWGQMALSSGTLWCLFVASETMKEDREQWLWKHENIISYAVLWYRKKKERDEDKRSLYS